MDNRPSFHYIVHSGGTAESLGNIFRYLAHFFLDAFPDLLGIGAHGAGHTCLVCYHVIICTAFQLTGDTTVEFTNKYAPNEFTGHVAAASTDAVYIDAPADGDAVVSVLGNDHLVTELRRRAGLDAPDVPDVPSDGAE